MKAKSIAGLLGLALIVGVAPGVSAQMSPSGSANEAIYAPLPSARVNGAPGSMVVVPMECQAASEGTVRRRIVDIAAREWGYFGFPIVDQMEGRRLLPPGMTNSGRVAMESSSMGWRRALDTQESERVAAAIAGYWAVTPEGAGIIASQNRAWNGSSGIGSRWVAPWSAAFISWVMCEAGLESSDRFRRAIAHREYIDQAIRARDGSAPGSAYVAYDMGEAAVEPGDMLCAGRRPQYRNIAERRRQMGTGASSHCDIVVKLDPDGARVLAIGGNVQRSVSLKVFPAVVLPDGRLRPQGGTGRDPFVHLKLRADPIEDDALDRSLAAAANCTSGFSQPAMRLALVASVVGSEPVAGEGLVC